MTRKLTPKQKIMRAKNKGRGLRLTAEDVFALSHDDAIAEVAWRDEQAYTAARSLEKRK